jgi:NADPH-dependent stearoyl-CoA 9-desaturase
MPVSTPALTPEQTEAFGAEMDTLRRRIVANLGAADAEYIRQVVRTQRRLEMIGRGLLFAGFLPPAWLGGVAALSLRRSSTIWRSGTTCCTASTTGCATTN